MRMTALCLAVLSIPVALCAREMTTDEMAVRAEKALAARYALRDLNFDPEKYALKSEPMEMKTYAPTVAAGMDEFEKADQAAVNEEARLVSKDGKNPEQADFEYALKKRFGPEVDIHDKMSALKVGPYAEPAVKKIVGRKGAAVEWARNHRWADATPKISRKKAAVAKVNAPRVWNAGGVEEGFLPAEKKYESTAAWNARKARKSN